MLMRKNEISKDTPYYPFDEEDVIVSGPTQGDKDPNVVGPFGGQWFALLYFSSFIFLCPDVMTIFNY